MCEKEQRRCSQSLIVTLGVHRTNHLPSTLSSIWRCVCVYHLCCLLFAHYFRRVCLFLSFSFSCRSCDSPGHSNHTTIVFISHTNILHTDATRVCLSFRQFSANISDICMYNNDRLAHTTSSKITLRNETRKKKHGSKNIYFLLVWTGN